MLLMVLFVRSRHLVKMVAMGAAFLMINLIAMNSFAFSMGKKWKLWQGNLRFHHDHYIIGNWGFDGSASAWNACKAILGLAYPLVHEGEVVGPGFWLNQAFQVYTALALVFAVVVCLHVVLVEREFFRRAILLLLLTSMAVPSGADYRLLFANIALIVMILLPTRRSYDLVVTGLLAVVLVPQNGFLLSSFGFSDGTYQGIPVSILINPLCILFSIGLLIRDGLQLSSGPLMRQKLLRLIAPVMRRPRTVG